MIASQEHTVKLTGKAIDASRESPIRPQSFDVMNGDSEGQALEASAHTSATVSLREEAVSYTHLTLPTIYSV